jgi:hypothetical protein
LVGIECLNDAYTDRFIFQKVLSERFLEGVHCVKIKTKIPVFLVPLRFK